ncbi:N2,N2-dimethylguanosine tRNA methyltransferase [Mollisia scopiformis]|uniref:tRNA (guanine(26)-N(2))-dimethyltransferase n=1 Tax=Mollisia scopiformis TaxID=149040 RepID=A0A194X2W4_MOLSC|nr:N2,N2-dimethylguanosine tRNA methyltransferase [Mollisia scopiformis]KUJ14521.1 N2,N2-dimethylguanosine tRNA methyltransferase [Mollisia scopiformis]
MSANQAADITALPAVDQHVVHDEKEYTTIKEGLAYILVPASGPKVPQTTPRGDNSAQSVFYNPIQQFNRDLSVLAIKAYGEEVVEAKKRAAERRRAKFKAKRIKKRKREENGEDDDASRKVGKLEGPESATLEANAGPDIMDAKPQIAPDSIAEQTVRFDEVRDPEPVGHDLDITTDHIANNGGPSTHTEQAEQAEVTSPESKMDDVANNEGSSTITEQIEMPPPKIRFSILDALSATGLRALRYAQEIPFATSITANDLLKEATKMIKLNVEHNKLEDRITAVTGNALKHMYDLVGEDVKDGNSKKYDVIDLDPYGTAAPFLDAAIQAVRDDGGLLCVTCTDAGVWASNGYPEKAYSLYGGVAMKGPMSHEAGLRLILHSIATTAARHGVAIEPLLSLSIDFYARVFVRVYKSPADVKFLAGKTMMVYNCDTGCGAWTTQMVARNKVVENKNGDPQWKHVFAQGPAANETCKICGFKTHIAGPMYGGPIHSPKFIKKILAGLPNVSKDTYYTTARIEGMLTLALEEVLPDLEADISPTATSKTKKYDPAAIDPTPFLFIPSALSKVIHCVTPIENAFRGALRHLGYRDTRSHTKPGSIKTDAPWEVIWEIMREWTKQRSPIKDGSIREHTAGRAIMGFDKKTQKFAEPEPNSKEADGKTESGASSEEKKIKVVFDEKLGGEKDTKKLVRYQLNPRENWGPMARARGK